MFSSRHSQYQKIRNTATKRSRDPPFRFGNSMASGPPMPGDPLVASLPGGFQLRVCHSYDFASHSMQSPSWSNQPRHWGASTTTTRTLRTMMTTTKKRQNPLMAKKQKKRRRRKKITPPLRLIQMTFLGNQTRFQVVVPRL